MNNLKIDSAMLGVVMYMFAIFLLGLFFGHRSKEFNWFMISLSCISIGSYFLIIKNSSFRNIFLLSYFGLILCLLLMNFNSILSNPDGPVYHKFIPIALLIWLFIYPFFTKNDEKVENAN
jgi:thiol:disulfide interchange protein